MRFSAITIILALAVFIRADAFADRLLPVDRGRVTSRIGYRADPFGSGRLVYHRGWDIAVPEGTPVYPVRQGTVLFAGINKGYGNLVVIDHGDGNLTMYGHNSRIMVSPGMRVDSRTAIALSGNTGRSTGPHVHFETARVKDYLGRWPSATPAAPDSMAAAETVELISGLETGGGEAGSVFSLPPDLDGTPDLISLQPVP